MNPNKSRGKLTRSNVLAIRKAKLKCKTRADVEALGFKFGVTWSNIYKIWRGKSYGWVA